MESQILLVAKIFKKGIFYEYLENNQEIAFRRENPLKMIQQLILKSLQVNEIKQLRSRSRTGKQNIGQKIYESGYEQMLIAQNG